MKNLKTKTKPRKGKNEALIISIKGDEAYRICRECGHLCKITKMLPMRVMKKYIHDYCCICHGSKDPCALCKDRVGK